MRESHIQEFREWMGGRAKVLAAKEVALTSEQSLGAALYSDQNLSLNRNQSCATCHSMAPAKDPISGANLPMAGFADPENLAPGSFVSKGSLPGKFGTLNTPSVGYAAFSPAFQWNKSLGMYVGGLFWNGRAATLHDQAALPMLNPVEMAMPSKWAVVTRLKENPGYRDTFKKLYKLDLNAIAENENASAQLTAPRLVTETFAAATRVIAEFEKSRVFNRFTSKFDFYLAGLTELTPQEKAGLDLFVGKANCATCHLAEPSLTADGKPFPPLFTDFTYDNIGLPRNARIPGDPEPDPGLGGRPEIKRKPTGNKERGKHKTVSIRNVAVTAPYGHNGVFPTLESIMHFYNTRDSLGHVASNEAANFGVSGWSEPEFRETANSEKELGAMNLTDEEEAAVVAFMKALTDDYPTTAGDPNVPPGTASPFPDAVPGIHSLRPFGVKGRSSAKRVMTSE